ncbi:MAG: hypothetical protein Q7S43_01835 [bacterium]|nr:hypothetical protein [bacterium]
MNKDFEKILEKVIVPNDKQGRPKFRFDFKSYSRMKILKIASIGVVSVFILLSFLGGGPFDMLRAGNDQGLKIKKPEEVALNDKFLAKVAELIILPNERPFIATVVDYKPLKDNPFFKDAKDGDKLLLFKGAGKAILYDPTLNKLLNTGTIEETGVKY